MTVKTLASGLSDKLQPNDIIRIYHFLETAEEVPELRFVKVLSVTDSDGVNVDNTKEPRRTKSGSNLLPSQFWRHLSRPDHHRDGKRRRRPCGPDLP